jgi:hypothetical protein
VRLFTFFLGVALILALSAGAGSAAAKTVWLCKPGLAANPCGRSLTTVVQADGTQRTFGRRSITSLASWRSM